MVVLYVRRNGVVTHADGVRVRRVPWWEVADRSLLGVPSTASMQVDIWSDRRVILKTTRLDLCIPLSSSVGYRAASERNGQGERRGRHRQLHESHVTSC